MAEETNQDEMVGYRQQPGKLLLPSRDLEEKTDFLAPETRK